GHPGTHMFTSTLMYSLRQRGLHVRIVTVEGGRTPEAPPDRECSGACGDDEAREAVLEEGHAEGRPDVVLLEGDGVLDRPGRHERAKWKVSVRHRAGGRAWRVARARTSAAGLHVDMETAS